MTHIQAILDDGRPFPPPYTEVSVSSSQSMELYTAHAVLISNSLGAPFRLPWVLVLTVPAAWAISPISASGFPKNTSVYLIY